MKYITSAAMWGLTVAFNVENSIRHHGDGTIWLLASLAASGIGVVGIIFNAIAFAQAQKR